MIFTTNRNFIFKTLALSLASVALIPCHTLAAQSDLTLGQKKFRRGDYSGAIKAFSKAGHSLDAELWLARSYRKNGNIAQTVARYKTILKLQPSNLEALTTLGELLSWKEQTRGEAIAMLQRAAAIKPEDMVLSKKLATIASWRQETRPIAIKEFSKVVANDPKDWQSAKSLAQMLSWNKDYANAEIYFKSFLQAHPDDTEMRLQYALMLSYQPERRLDAISQFEALMHLMPADKNVLRGLAETELWAKQYQSSIDHLTQLVDKNPTDRQLKNDLAQAYYYSKQYKQALVLFNELGVSASKDVPSKIQLATALCELGQCETANQIFEELSTQRDIDELTMANVLLAKGHCLITQGKLEQAQISIDRLRRAPYLDVMSKSMQVSAVLELATIAGKLENWADVETYCKQALGLEPKTDSAKFMLTGALTAENKLDEAQAILATLTPEYQSSPDYQRVSADIDLAAKRYPEALELYRALLASHPEDSDARLQLAQAYLQMKMYKEAQDNFKQVKEDRRNRAFLGLIHARSEDGDNEGARKLIAEGLSENKIKNTDVLQLAESLSSLENERPFALELTRMILEKEPTNDQASLLQARILSWDASSRLESLPLYESYLAKHQNDIAIKEEHADVLSWTGNTKAANNIYGELLATKSDNRELLLKQARVLSWRGKLDAAIKIYKSVLVDDATNREALTGLGECNSWGGDFLKAENIFSKASSLYPDDAQITYDRAMNYKGLGRYDKAYNYAQLSLTQMQKLSAPALQRIR
jgi:tetratricopeptide (TPR) repeat protein